MTSLVNIGIRNMVLSVRTASLLAQNFNILLIQAIESGAEYFLLWHSDVVPEGKTWGARMIEIMRRDKLDVLGTAIPIKDDSGDTSTAVVGKDGVIRRIPMSWDGYAATVKSSDMFIGMKLMLNTGLMMIRIKALDPKAQHFKISDAVVAEKDGLGSACMPEDWNFSLMLHAAAVPYGATNEIEVRHYGSKAWTNRGES